MSLMSAPAMKTFLPDVSTMPRTASSAAARAVSVSSPAMTSGVSTLTDWPGRSMVSRAMPSASMV